MLEGLAVIATFAGLVGLFRLIDHCLYLRRKRR
jgi:hypothetical protein